MSELLNRVNERIAKTISRIASILMNEISVSTSKLVSLLCHGDFNRKFEVHMVLIQMIRRVKTLGSSLPLKYDLLLGPHS